MRSLDSISDEEFINTVVQLKDRALSALFYTHQNTCCNAQEREDDDREYHEICEQFDEIIRRLKSTTTHHA